ncbi:MAG: HAD family phosphatase [Anaerolineae bacterium]|nr:HAD family phosphatase [Anaerolineae bacterium]NUQ07091.1 HAD family phosphatase [Anaerolineae bacterium]
MPIDAVIFDMDGVLVDSEQYWWEARVEFAAERGLQWTMEFQRLAMGRSTVEWAQVMQERLHLDMALEAIMDDVIGRVSGKLSTRFPALPGALEAVHTAAQGYPVALASGSPTRVIQSVMAITGLDRIFQTVVYGDDMAHGKPAPDIYFETARRLGVDPAHCLGIEDSGNGVRALHAAGMKIVAVPSPGFALSEEVLALADLALPSLESFSLEMIRSLA